jgi:hypothetical protein
MERLVSRGEAQGGCDALANPTCLGGFMVAGAAVCAEDSQSSYPAAPTLVRTMSSTLPIVLEAGLVVVGYTRAWTLLATWD